MILYITTQISMEWETKLSSVRYRKHLNLHWLRACMCRYRLNQHLIVLNLYKVSINEILVMVFIVMRIPQNLNLKNVKLLTQWNQQLSRYKLSKVIEYLALHVWKEIDRKRP